MRCPSCHVDKDRVIDSRAAEDGFSIRRRRACLRCGRRYTTYERFDSSILRVVKKDGTRVPFAREKILLGIQKACEKRPVSAEAMEAAVVRIEQDVGRRFEKEVPTRVIGELVMRELKKLDPVAYVRFASVYREFKDVGDFMDEIRGLPQRGRAAHRRKPA